MAYPKSKRRSACGQIHDFRLLRSRAAPGNGRLARFHAIIMFRDETQFAVPFAEVAAAGVHAGRHGSMIENVTDFIVEIFEELPDAAAVESQS